MLPFTRVPFWEPIRQTHTPKDFHQAKLSELAAEFRSSREPYRLPSLLQGLHRGQHGWAAKVNPTDPEKMGEKRGG